MAPQLPTPDDRITSGKQLAQFASELQDSEVAEAMQVIVRIQQRWSTRANTADNLEAMRDEVLTRLMQIGIVATFDPTPCLHGEPPIVEIIGSTGLDPTDGFDHERKGWEVRESVKRNESYLGERGRSA